MVNFLDLFVFLIPIYIANSAPVVLGGGSPLDLGMMLPDKKRLLGTGKTVRGFVAGVLAGTVAGGLIAAIYLLPFFSNSQEQFAAAFVLALGAMCGDALGSFIKRRVGKERGRPFILDTVFFVIVALVFVFPFAKSELFEAFNITFILVLTLILHPLTNAIANQLGLKSVPW